MRVLVLLCFCQLEWYHISWWWHLHTFNKRMHIYILSPRDSQVKIFIKVVQTTVWHFCLHTIFKKKSCSLFNPRKNPSFRIPGPLRNACLGLDLKGSQMTLCCQSPYQHCAKSRCCCQQGLWPDQLPAMRHILFLRDLYWWMNYHQWQPKVDQADLQMTEDVQNLGGWPQAFPSNLPMDQQLQGSNGEYDLVWTSTQSFSCAVLKRHYAISTSVRYKVIKKIIGMWSSSGVRSGAGQLTSSALYLIVHKAEPPMCLSLSLLSVVRRSVLFSGQTHCFRTSEQCESSHY